MDSPDQRADGGDSGEESLSELLRSWRRRADPRTFSGLPVHGRRGKGLTHNDVARLAGVSARWYGSLEQGREAGYSVDFLDRVSAALRLSRAERQALYLRAVGRPPALAAVPAPDATAEMDETLQRFIDNQLPDPAVVTDLAWNMIGYNEATRLWLPGAVEYANQMRWTFLSPDAHEQLVDWDRDWARPYLGQVRYERANHPKNEALQRLENEILEGSPAARRIWDQREMVDHGDGMLRRVKLPYHQGREVAVRTVALRPARSDILRVTVLMEEGQDPVVH
ncbi:helix-turn-helix transcriptional regulator [Streptomyces sp. V4-01]|uniref:Helix-turn-helix transcriptional regulator n=1 Tax=Actinacidiphila polyblastidii TaxID=3110430 RepID=A0ABU7PCX7_9ACTN|nr:helix-turn-helix transcriptional regulator [Streptomyces sp. V4-01]